MISGTHGDAKGKLLRKDAENFTEHDKTIMVDIIKGQKGEEMEKQNINFSIIDIWKNVDKNEELDPRKIGKTVRDEAPTALVLAYCFSEVSELRPILDGEGISARIFLLEEKMHLTGKRYVLSFSE